jgi:hypothetical protein
MTLEHSEEVTAIEAAHPLTAAGAGAGRDLAQILWSAHTGSTPATMLAQPWLDSLCEQLPGLITGFVLLQDSTGAYALAASKPIDVLDQVYLRRLAEKALAARKTLLFRPPRLNTTRPRHSLIIASPMVGGNECFGAVVVLLTENAAETAASARGQIETALGWLHAARFSALQATTDATLGRARVALRTLAIIDEHASLQAASMQLAAHIENALPCERASVGMRRREARIEIVALSHSGGFDVRSEEARRVQSAMEEAFDQDATVIVPQTGDDVHALALAHRALGADRAVLSVVLRAATGKCGVITLERPASQPFASHEISAIELLASLTGPALLARKEADEWISGRALNKALSFHRSLLGPRRPGLKLIAAMVALAVLFLAFATGEHRVAAKAVVEGLVQRAASAPYDGFVATANLRAGAVVRKGDVLATLDDRDLRLERSRWLGEREQRLKQYGDAFAKHDRANSAVLAAQLEQAESQLALAEENLSRARITAPVDGLVVAGDLSQLVGSPVEKGKVLFEVAPLEAFRVILRVDERDILHLKVGQPGELAITGVAGRRIPFRVRNLTSITQADEGHNLFRVEAELRSAGAGIRPGMEGIGKVEVGRRSLFWIWTHRFFDWLQLKLWTLTP